MINKIKVVDIYTAHEITSNKHEWDSIISLYDPAFVHDIEKIKHNNTKQPNNEINHIVYLFEDIDEQWLKAKGKDITKKEEFEKYIECDGAYIKNAVCPQPKAIRNIIEYGKLFSNSNTSHNILIHCHAGVSRSSAVAIILHHLSGKSEKEAILHTFRDRKAIWPNQLILRIADKYLNSNLYEEILEWKKKETEKGFSSLEPN